jgi:hypothetical protein
MPSPSHNHRPDQPRDRRDEAIQLGFHELEAGDVAGFGRHRVIDEEARQIEQACEPTDNHDDMKCFDPQIHNYSLGCLEKFKILSEARREGNFSARHISAYVSDKIS